MQVEFWWGSLLESSILEGKEGRRIVVERISKKWVQRISAGPGEGSVMYTSATELV